VTSPGLGLEAIELVSELLKVVDLTVEYQHYPAIVADHGLVTQGGEVEDSQAGVAQAKTVLKILKRTGIIGTAVSQGGLS